MASIREIVPSLENLPPDLLLNIVGSDNLISVREIMAQRFDLTLFADETVDLRDPRSGTTIVLGYAFEDSAWKIEFINELPVQVRQDVEKPHRVNDKPDLETRLASMTPEQTINYAEREVRDHILELKELHLKLNRLDNTLKESVQNAVDIVQTKRIDLIGQKDFEIEKLVALILICAAIEFGLVALAGAAIGMVAGSLISSIAFLGRKALPFTGKVGRQSTVLNGLANDLASLKEQLRLNKMLVGSLPKSTSPGQVNASLLAKTEHLTRRIAKQKVHASNKEYERFYRLTATRMKATYKNTALRDNVTKSAKSAKPVINALVKGRPKMTMGVDRVLPFDAAFKVVIQNLFSDELHDYEDIIFHLESIRMMIPDTPLDSVVDFLSELDTILPPAAETRSRTADLSPILAALPAIKDDITRAFELIIWVGITGASFDVSYYREDVIAIGMPVSGASLYGRKHLISKREYEQSKASASRDHKYSYETRKPENSKALLQYLNQRFFDHPLTELELIEFMVETYDQLAQEKLRFTDRIFKDLDLGLEPELATFIEQSIK